MDKISRENRSRNMAAIRSKDTKPEIYLRKLLFSKGYRYRLHEKKIPGKPDLWMRKYNTAIFIHGCFWHQHEGCRDGRIPKSRVEFWTEKFRRNRERDEKVKKDLEKRGIRCLVLWECTVKKMKKSESSQKEILREIEKFLSGDSLYLEL